MNSKVVYTCITGGYDKLYDPLVISQNTDYICFSDNPGLKSNIWQIRPIPLDLVGLSQVKQQRIVKICPHRYLPAQYDVSIWVDGNILVTGDVNRLLFQYDLDKTPLYTRIHPSNKDAYQEALLCRKLGKESKQMIDRIIARYEKEGYPHNTGMSETCVLLRRHNDRKCVLIDESWATELLLNSHRDQLSFNYVCWKNRFLPGYMVNQFKINNNEYFRIIRHAR